MTIEDPVYRRILKKRILKIKRISKILATDKHAANNYIEKLKKSTLEKQHTTKRPNTIGGSRKKFIKKQNRSIRKGSHTRSHVAFKKTTLKRRKKYSSKRK
jgi:hypothetical protein